MRHTRTKAHKDRKARHSVGTLRRSNAPAKLTDRSLIARWVEAETVRLKRQGFAFTAIAAHITGVAAAKKQPAIALPQVQLRRTIKSPRRPVTRHIAKRCRATGD